jgi:thioredoxin-dependent peroxiredoxin
MAITALGGNPVNTNGTIPQIGSQAIDFSLAQNDLSSATLANFTGNRVILNIFPSIDTGVCATSVRTFNKMASDLDNTKVVCVSRDLPFAQKRFCGAEGIENTSTLSDFESGSFGKNYGLELIDGPLHGLHARAVVVLDEAHKVIHVELVSDIANEPNYEAAIAVL